MKEGFVCLSSCLLRACVYLGHQCIVGSGTEREQEQENVVIILLLICVASMKGTCRRADTNVLFLFLPLSLFSFTFPLSLFSSRVVLILPSPLTPHSDSSSPHPDAAAGTCISRGKHRHKKPSLNKYLRFSFLLPRAT